MERTLDSLRRMDLWVSGEGRLVYACFSFFFFNSRLRILGELCNASCQCQCHYSLHSRIRVAISEALETLKAEVALSDIPSPPFLSSESPPVTSNFAFSVFLPTMMDGASVSPPALRRLL